jgi:hypothetical protein
MVPVPKEKLQWKFFNENLSLVVDGVAAVLILGAPAVAWWEKQHHTTLNPIERRKHKQMVQKKKTHTLNSIKTPL